MTELGERATGSIVSFDGLDCAGKSTQISLLAEKLRKLGKRVHVDARVWDGHIGQALTALITGDEPAPVECLAHLFTAEAILRFHSTVVPELEAGAVVLSDRSYYSGFAYNLALGATTWEWNEVCNSWAVEPRLAFFIDLDPELAWIRRCARAETQREQIEVGFKPDPKAAFIKTQEAARAVFARFANEGRLIVVDGSGEIEPVAAEIWSAVGRCLDEPVDER